jgi:hypothetical protein
VGAGLGVKFDPTTFFYRSGFWSTRPIAIPRQDPLARYNHEKDKSSQFFICDPHGREYFYHYKMLAFYMIEIMFLVVMSLSHSC